jgi:type IV secretory pathway VirB3-like protein
MQQLLRETQYTDGICRNVSVIGVMVVTAVIVMVMVMVVMVIGVKVMVFIVVVLSSINSPSLWHDLPVRQ